MYMIGLILVGISVLAAVIKVEKLYAQEGTVIIQHYEHSGCMVGGQRVLPTFADGGGKSEFRMPEESERCFDLIKTGVVTCEWATEFLSVNPQGHPWKPGEKELGCLEVFRQEIAPCKSHYETQRPKCERPRREPRVESADCKFARQTFAGYEAQCQSGNRDTCGILDQARAIVEQACR